MNLSNAVGVQVALPMAASLGEGLHWDPVAQRLWGVDIHARRVWRWDLSSSSALCWTLDQRVGWVLPMGKDPTRVLLGLQGGVAIALADQPDAHAWVHQPFASASSMRLNDAKADRTGALWTGSLNNDDESQVMGSLFRLDNQRGWHVMDEGYAVPNGPAINAESTVMLHSDSARREIYRFDLDAERGEITNKRVWVAFDAAQGYPDGMCFDASGCIWVAHWGGARISRWTLDGEQIDQVVLPTSHVTNVCFGGARLDRLFVTTARAGLTQQQLADEPLAGHLFEILNHGARGLPGLPWGGV